MSAPAPMTSDLAAAGLRYDVSGEVATITLSRPQTRNAQSPLMWAALREIGSELPPAVRVVVVRGDGPGFSSGLDRRMLSPQGMPDEPSLFGQSVTAGPDALDETRLDALLTSYQEAFSWLRATPAITVAAVHGYAIGAGFQLALACDLRVLAADARFAMREPMLGLVPDLGGTKPLVDAVGYARALEICVTGREIDAAEARELGLATIVVPVGDLDGAVADLTEALTSAPHRAVSATKALLRDAPDRTYRDQLAAERKAQIARIRDLVAQGSGNKKRRPRVGDHDE